MSPARRELVIYPEVTGEVLEIAAHISEDNPAAAARFMRAVAFRIDQLRDSPMLGRAVNWRLREFRGVRSIILAQYRNYIVYYRVTRRSVEVIGVLHGARRVRTLLKSRIVAD